MNLTEIVQSAGWKNFMAKLYGIGASIVIIGAMFKIQHWPGGGMMIPGSSRPWISKRGFISSFSR